MARLTEELYELLPPRLLSKAAVRVLRGAGVEVREDEVEYLVSEVPPKAFGDYGIPIARYSRLLKGINLDEVTRKIAEELRRLGGNIVKDVRRVGGYLNVALDAAELSRKLFEAVREDGLEFGLVKVGSPKRIVVEHTSANPVHPLHIGHARNMCLGDVLARLLRARGHAVQTRFYVNDMGRQVAVLAYGVLRAKLRLPQGVKPDHWIGLVYAMTHTLVDAAKLRKEVEELKRKGDYENYREKLSELDDALVALAKLKERDPELFDKLSRAVLSDDDPEKRINEIMRAYEFKTDEEVVRTIRNLVELCLEGFRETMRRMGVEVDVWDWESDLAWSGMVSELLEKVKRSPYFTMYKGAMAIDLESIQRDEEVLEKLGAPKSIKIPPLVLARSDGTTLYTTRDVVYTIKKFRDFSADMVINVIAAEQRLEQLQVRLALIALGYRREGLNTIHYAYEMVTLPGIAMSGRRGQYITLDELLDAAVAKALEEARKRSELDPQMAEKVAEAVGVAAVRYALISVAASKPMTFKIEDAVNFERNSAPYIQYTHARAHNILVKAGSIDWSNIDYAAAEEDPLRRSLVLQCSMFPYVFAKSADELRPEILVAYLNKLADTFNAWYPRDHVIREPNPGKRNFKLALVYTVRTVLRNALSVIGIPALERM